MDTCPTLTFNTIGLQSPACSYQRCIHDVAMALQVHIGDITPLLSATEKAALLPPMSCLRHSSQTDRIATQYVDATGTQAWTTPLTPTALSWLSRALPAPMVVSWARWATRTRLGLYKNLSQAHRRRPVPASSRRRQSTSSRRARRLQAISARGYPFRYGYRVSIRIRC